MNEMVGVCGGVLLSPSPFPLIALRGQILELLQQHTTLALALIDTLAPNKPTLPLPHLHAATSPPPTIAIQLGDWQIPT